MARKQVLKLALLLVLVLSIVLSSMPLVTASAADSNGAGTNATFYNRGDIPGGDPNIFYDPVSGYYYLYSSSGGKAGYRFGIYKSADLTTWEQLNGAIPYNNRAQDPIDTNIWADSWFWAPECYYNPNNGYYYLIYTGRVTQRSKVDKWFGVWPFDEGCMGAVCVSRSPEGPFYHITNEPMDYRPYDPYYHDVNQIMDSTQFKPPATKELGETAPLGVYLPFIDVHMLFDDDGEIYLYYSRNAYRNWVWDDDLGKYIEESNIYAVKLTKDWWYNSPTPTMPTIDPAYVDSNRLPGDDSPINRDGFVPIINYAMQKQNWENGHVNDYTVFEGRLKDRRWAEGPMVRKMYYTQDGVQKYKYYIMYSCNNVDNEWYGEGYAYADNPLGPFTKGENNPIVKKVDGDLYSTGHGCWITSPDDTQLYHVYHGRPNMTTTRYLYTDQFVFDPEVVDSNGVPMITVNQVIGDQPIPSGVAPYKMDLTCAPKADNPAQYDVTFDVTNKDGGSLYLDYSANRVNVTFSNPAAATYTQKDNYSGTIELLTDEEVTATFTYQRQKADGSYFDILNDSSNASSVVQRRVTLQSDGYTVPMGGSVVLPIRLKDCDGFAGMSGTLSYDRELLTLESISARKGFSLVSEGDSFVVASNGGAALQGDVIVGYALFSAKGDLEDDVTTAVSVPAAGVIAYDAALNSINPNIPDIQLTILGPTPILGDVNKDGKVDVADAILLMQYLAGSRTLSAGQLRAADVNQDGKVNVGDVTIIMQMCLPA